MGTTNSSPVEVGGRDGIERTLIEKAKQGDRKSQELLLRQYESSVFDLIMRIVRNRDDAMDALQDTMVKAIMNLNRYDARYDFGKWLVRIATTTALDVLRKRRREAKRQVDGGLEDIASKESPVDSQVVNKITAEAIEKAMEELDTKYRTVLLLRYRHELSYAEIADALSMPIGTVKILLHRAHKTLKQLVKEGGWQ